MFASLLEKSLWFPIAPGDNKQVKLDSLTAIIQSFGFSVDSKQTTLTKWIAAISSSETIKVHEFLQVSKQEGQEVLVLNMKQINRLL